MASIQMRLVTQTPQISQPSAPLHTAGLTTETRVPVRARESKGSPG